MYKGRQFYCCPKPREQGCGFFLFADGMPRGLLAMIGRTSLICCPRRPCAGLWSLRHTRELLQVWKGKQPYPPSLRLFIFVCIFAVLHFYLNRCAPLFADCTQSGHFSTSCPNPNSRASGSSRFSSSSSSKNCFKCGKVSPPRSNICHFNAMSSQVTLRQTVLGLRRPVQILRRSKGRALSAVSQV